MIDGVIVAGVAAVALMTFVVYALVVYNRGVRLVTVAEESWANIEAALQNRHNVVRSMVLATQAAGLYEQNLQQASVSLRSGAVAAVASAEAKVNADISLLTEQYPVLKTGATHRKLFSSLVETEDAIQANRLLYNRAVALHARQLESFPTRPFMVLFGHVRMQFFEMQPSETNTKK